MDNKPTEQDRAAAWEITEMFFTVLRRKENQAYEQDKKKHYESVAEIIAKHHTPD